MTEEYEFDETAYSKQCSFFPDYIKVIENQLLDLLLDGHPIEIFEFVDNHNIHIKNSCGKEAILSDKEIYYKLCDVIEKLEKDSFISCKEGNGHNKYNFYSRKLKKNLCDECLGKEELNRDSKDLFNFDNNYYKYYIVGEQIKQKFLNDDITPNEIKKSFEIIFSIFKKNYNDFSYFIFIKGYYNFYKNRFSLIELND